MSESVVPQAVTFVSRFNRVMAVVIWAIAAFVLVATVAGDAGRIAEAVVSAAFVALGTWVVLWRPCVRVTDEGPVLVNVGRRVVVPWAALILVDTKFSLTLHTPGATFGAWSAPAPGRAGAAVARRTSTGRSRPAGLVGDARPGDLLSTDSGAAASLIRDRWDDLRESGALALGEADTTTVRVEWLWQPLVALAVLAAATVVALAAG